MDNCICSSYQERMNRSAFSSLALGCLFFLLGVPVICHAELPSQLMGIALGSPISQYEEALDMATDVPDRNALYLNEVTLRRNVFPGVRGGSISYGNCAAPGTVVEVQLKLKDRSQGLFDDLYDRYEARFGKPDEYQGDAFKTIISWKWIFKQGKEEVQTVLTWSRDPEMRPGTSIKLRQRSLMRAEYDCHRERREKNGNGMPPQKLTPKQLEQLIPKAPQ